MHVYVALHVSLGVSIGIIIISSGQAVPVQMPSTAAGDNSVYHIIQMPSTASVYHKLCERIVQDP